MWCLQVEPGPARSRRYSSLVSVLQLLALCEFTTRSSAAAVLPRLNKVSHGFLFIHILSEHGFLPTLDGVCSSRPLPFEKGI